MNGDRNYQPQTVSDRKFGFDLLGRIKSLPVVKRVYLYIVLMTLVGAAMGTIKYRLESIDCNTKSQCWLVKPNQRKARDLGVGAVAGAIAATLISIPALLKES
ncbi:MAG: hypothetical protein AAFQ41_10965 [Cyanobacteria bacterium J06623_7]